MNLKDVPVKIGNPALFLNNGQCHATGAINLHKIGTSRRPEGIVHEKS